MGKERIDWLEPAPVLSQFSDKAGKACAMFAAFVSDRMAEGRRGEFHGEKSVDSRLFGDNSFVEEVLLQTESLPEHKPDIAAVVDAVTKLYRMSTGQLAAPGQERTASEARGLAAWATRELSSGTLAELARTLGRNPSTLTCAVTRLENRLAKDPLLVEKVKKLRRDLQGVQIFKA